jgi:hypothetical protein
MPRGRRGEWREGGTRWRAAWRAARCHPAAVRGATPTPTPRAAAAAAHRVAALAGRQGLEVVGRLVVEERDAVGAANADAAPVGAVDERRAVGERLEHLARVVERRGHVGLLSGRGGGAGAGWVVGCRPGRGRERAGAPCPPYPRAPPLTLNVAPSASWWPRTSSPRSGMSSPSASRSMPAAAATPRRGCRGGGCAAAGAGAAVGCAARQRRAPLPLLRPAAHVRGAGRAPRAAERPSVLIANAAPRMGWRPGKRDGGGGVERSGCGGEGRKRARMNGRMHGLQLGTGLGGKGTPAAELAGAAPAPPLHAGPRPLPPPTHPPPLRARPLRAEPALCTHAR